MNIDIKNALDNVLLFCSSKCKDNAVNIFINDIYSFIMNISKKNGEERFEFFCLTYLKDKNNNGNNTYASFDSYKIFDYFCNLNSYNSSCDQIIVFTALESFFLQLGKFYLTNMPDRRDIDKTRVIGEIQKMQKYTENNYDSDGCVSGEKTVICENSEIKRKLKTENDSSFSDLHKGESENNQIPEPEESLEELLEKLYSLVGLQEVKAEVNNIINLIKVRKKGIELGEKTSDMSFHLVFYGNPGTGKTTVARLIGKIYKALGVLSSGQTIEVDRGGLVGGYVGSTAIKTQELIDKAMGGILFIDEAYTLTHGKAENDFGQEAVDTILKAMEDHRDDFIVIVAGYPELMKEFIASNPGLKSRFNLYIDFEDYSPDELVKIFKFNTVNYVFEDGCDEYLIKYFETLYNNRNKDYANGRDVRNYYEKVLRAQANRLAPIIDSVSREDYLTITYSDLVTAAEMMKTI